jgi:Cu/Ag efflux pump CusA
MRFLPRPIPVGHGYHAVIEATVQRTRPVILTALAAVLAFVPLTHSVFWGSMAYTLTGGTAVGTVLILLFLPALYAAWFRIKPTADEIHEAWTEEPELRAAMAAE